ncbi:hypothetical protein AGMMS49959_07420 [Planctomycetales bacterium]|nr:hypothetical protein AGMMS49959_07420 [Planctomycetales bacterium]
MRRLDVPELPDANNGQNRFVAEQLAPPPSAPPVAVKKDFFDAKKENPVVPVIAPIAGAQVAAATTPPVEAKKEFFAAREEQSAPMGATVDENAPNARTRTIILPTAQSINYDTYYGDEPAFTPKEANQIAISDAWASGGTAMDVQGAVTFAFGLQQPSIVCAVFQVTDIELQAGEVVQSVIVGDSLRWGIDAMISAGTTPHIVVKPVDSGLTTSMVVATDRRTYHFALKSSRRNYMSRVLFTYPQEAAAKFEQQRKDAEAKAQAERERATIPETNEYLGDLNFNYRVSGNTPWKPTRVYNDGTKTIIEMPRLMKSTESPALLVKQGGEETLVNYRVQGDRYVVDAVFKEAILIAGHGRKQQKVTLTYLDYGKKGGRQ